MIRIALLSCCIFTSIVSYAAACDIDPNWSYYYNLGSSSSYKCSSSAKAACENAHGCVCNNYQTGGNSQYQAWVAWSYDTSPWTVYVYAYCGDQQGCAAAVCNACVTSNCEQDGDGDGLPDDDDPCPNDPNPNCTPPPASCGNNLCEPNTGETADNCSADCGTDDENCPEDGGSCGDSLCCGDETAESCPADCAQGGISCDGWDGITALNPFQYNKDGSSIASKFGDRFKQFIEAMRETSIFSIPDQIFDGSAGSGDSTLSYNGGEYLGGQQEIDFSNWSPGLAVLRGCLYLVFGVIAFRIVTLHQ